MVMAIGNNQTIYTDSYSPKAKNDVLPYSMHNGTNTSI